MGRYIWIAVEADKYELPIAIADTAKELAAIMGVSIQTINSATSRGDSGKQSGRKFMRVRNDD